MRTLPMLTIAGLLLLPAMSVLAEKPPDGVNAQSDVINNLTQPQLEFAVYVGNERQKVKANPRFFVRVDHRNHGAAETWVRDENGDFHRATFYFRGTIPCVKTLNQELVIHITPRGCTLIFNSGKRWVYGQ